MSELEILLNDLSLQKTQIELERGLKITKQHILAFVAILLAGDENDKEYQRKIIDNLISMVYIYNHHYVVYLSLSGGKGIEHVSLQDTNEAFQGVLGVQPLSALVHQARLIRTRIRAALACASAKLRPMVKRLRHRPFTAVTGVRVPLG